MRHRFQYLLAPLLLVLMSAALHAERTLEWQFPLPRTHTGILLGNGVQGLMIWGEGGQLNITISRAGFWDHRNGMRFATGTTYQDVRRLLEAHDEEGLKRAFGQSDKPSSLPRPHQLGGGRLQITLPSGWHLDSGRLRLEQGIVEITAVGARGKSATLTIRQSVSQELSWVGIPASLQGRLKISLVPSWDFIQETLRGWGVAPPSRWQSGSGSGGFLQTLPEDLPLAVAYRRAADHLLMATALDAKARQKAEALLEGADPAQAAVESQRWWHDYWASVPRISLPDPVLQEIVDYGLYKEACCTPPQGVACTLQGPFMEAYQVPPWSNDYHFNINIQMIYWPCLASNRIEHFRPLWKMLEAWMPEMRKNGEHFFQAKGAITLPHAVDDRGQIPGFFWTGMMDHASTAWVAEMAWLQYRYTLDPGILKELAWPLLKGAFEGYWAMLERVPDGKGGERLSIPVSVSPEFRGSRMDAWGRDASFQLAACHMLAQILPQAAAVLGEPVDPRWEQVERELPPYCTIKAEASLENTGRLVRRIALWEGMDLVQSHRHHSHLASIYPFRTIDPRAPEHADIVAASIEHWVYMGPGAWSGWCVPWASTIHARLGETEAAVAWLHFWKDVFTNVGRGTLHNANFPGVSVIRSPVWSKLPPGRRNSEIMPLDAGFGALTAVFELLVQNWKGEIRVLPGLDKDWRVASFDNVGAEGAFRVGATVRDHRVQQVRVESLKGGHLRLRPNLGERWSLNGTAQSGELLERDCRPGEYIVLERLP